MIENRMKNATLYSVNITNNKRTVSQNERVGREGFSKIVLLNPEPPSLQKSHQKNTTGSSWYTVQSKSLCLAFKVPYHVDPICFCNPVSYHFPVKTLHRRLNSLLGWNLQQIWCSPSPVSLLPVSLGWILFQDTRVCLSSKAQLLEHASIYNLALPSWGSLGSSLFFQLDCTFQADMDHVLHSHCPKVQPIDLHRVGPQGIGHLIGKRVMVRRKINEQIIIK